MKYGGRNIKIKGPVHHLALSVLALDLFVITWFLDAGIRTLIFGGGDFIQHAFRPAPIEMWVRLFFAFVVLASLFSARLNEVMPVSTQAGETLTEVPNLARRQAPAEPLIPERAEGPAVLETPPRVAS